MKILLKKLQIFYTHFRYSSVKYFIILICIMSYQLFLNSTVQQQTISGWDGPFIEGNVTHTPLIAFSHRQKNGISRKQYRSGRQEYNNRKEKQNFRPLHQITSAKDTFSKTDKFVDVSNIYRMKKKMQNIDKDNDRWEQQFILKESTQQLVSYRKNRHRMAKAQTQNDERNQRKLDNSKDSFKSIKYQCNQEKNIGKYRPMSCQRENGRPSLALSMQIHSKSKSIHNKTGSKMPFSTKNRLNRGAGSLNICINQLQNSKMKQILKCLDSLH